jgi:hypothetical protein
VNKGGEGASLVSVVTVTQNRTHHVIESARAVSRMSMHDEHIILDYGSAVPVSRAELPPDSRVRLIRANPTRATWSLSESYNLALSLTKSEWILKVDADVILSNTFEDTLCFDPLSAHAEFFCSRLTLGDWSLPDENYASNGLFLAKRSLLEKIRGFNPYLNGWGWEDIDLYSRVFLAGATVAKLPHQGVTTIPHDAADSVGVKALELLMGSGIPPKILGAVSAENIKGASSTMNRAVAIKVAAADRTWPDFAHYRKQFKESGGPPAVSKITLFSADEKKALERKILSVLVPGSRAGRWFAKLGGKMGWATWERRNVSRLLEACGISFSDVT